MVEADVGVHAGQKTSIETAEAKLTSLWPLARSRLYSWNGFPTWFRLNRRFTLRLFRPSRVKVVVPSYLLPDCHACVELCCTGQNSLVSLRLLDIARLIDAGLDAFITPRSAASIGAAQPTKGTTAARRRLEGSVYAQIFPVLARDDTQTCRLLTTDRQCGAHPAWPLSCRRYPYAFDATNNVVFLAKGCDTQRTMTIDDAPDAVRQLVHAAVTSYNERVKDIILLHVALPELWRLGLLSFLELDEKLAAQALKFGPLPARPLAQSSPTPRKKVLPIVD